MEKIKKLSEVRLREIKSRLDSEDEKADEEDNIEFELEIQVEVVRLKYKSTRHSLSEYVGVRIGSGESPKY